MLRLATILDGINEIVGRAVSWLVLALALVQLAVVVMRYVFGAGSIWAQESVIYMHASIFMLAAGYTAVRDGHVRVSILYDRAGPRAKAAIDLFGAVTMLLPFTAVVFYESLPYVRRSWAILEGSREAAGLPAIFLLKTLILAFAVLLAIAGVSMICKTLALLTDRNRPA